MEIKSTLEMLKIIWPIFVAIGGFVIYKVVPYLRTEITINKYYNATTSFVLIEYESIGTLVASVVAMVFAIIFGKSTFKLMLFGEWCIAQIAVILIYLLGIYLIVKFKTEKGPQKYIRNLFFGIAIYIIVSVQILLILVNKDEKKYNAVLFLFCIAFIVLQVWYNIELEQIKSIKYIVLTKEENFYTLYKPVKRGKYYFIRITDKEKNEIKRIQLPEERIDKIEYIIENVEDSGTIKERQNNDGNNRNI